EGIAGFKKKEGMSNEEQTLIHQVEADLELTKGNYSVLKQGLEGIGDSDVRKIAGFTLNMDAGLRQSATRVRDSLQKLIDIQKTDAAKANEEVAQIYASQRRIFITI